ncbi:MAG: hypothetical protein M5U19_16875 [Microthrixaceae bacterium]|nr:hypothetical protein [Microthrixaceae bacterium]
MPRQDSLFTEFAREVVEVPVTEELGESFLAYSLSVITSRAIPDVRDGLKPVQRRILHAMSSMGLRPDRPHRKSAGVVGETMGKYHPHGDSAIYDALTRMGQGLRPQRHPRRPAWQLRKPGRPAGRVPLHGVPPERRRARDMLGEIDEDTVEFRPTFDGERAEPIHLPAKLPNLLVNGSTGIAVGMATNMAPHNLREVYEAVKLVMKKRRPKPTVAELMEVLPGPDFPSGGTIIDESLADAYAHGKGSIRIRARNRGREADPARDGIVVTELPYLVGPERVVARIQELMRSDKLPQVTDVKNTSDRRTGLRLEIELKPGANANAVLTELFRTTPLEESFGINNVVLVDGVPTTVGLWELCNHYIEHRLEVVERRTRYRLERSRRRLHLVEGLLIALDAIDLVVSIIRSSQDAAQARNRLMDELSLTDVQAVHILDMQLRRLTALAKLELQAEADELRERIDGFEKILGSEQRRRTLVLAELEEMADTYGWERRSTIVTPDDLNDVTLTEVAEAERAERAEEPCVLALTHSELLGREPVEGPRKATFGRHDLLTQRVTTTTHSTVCALTTKARVFAIDVDSIEEVTGRKRGTPLRDLVPLDKGESVLHVVAPAVIDEPPPLMLVSAGGRMKRMEVTEITTTPDGRTAMNLKQGDTLVAAFAAPEGDEMIAVASNAQAMRCAVDAVSIQGRSAAGSRG